MAEIISIDIEVNSNREKLLTIPERIEAPQFSIVQWNVKDFDQYLYKVHSPFRSLIFTLYFNAESPFSWKRNFIQLYDPHFGPFYSKVIRLAEDVVGVKGDFKYGVSVFNVDQNETIFDDDPYLKVF